MRQVKKFKLSKTHKLIIVLASLLVLLISSYFIINAVSKHFAKDPAVPETPYYNAELGETIYLGNAVCYAPIKQSDILSLVVVNKDESYDLTRYPDDNGGFWLSYDNGEGVNQMIPYIPPIMGEEADFSYDSVYATENQGLAGAPILTYLFASVNAPTITERIELPTGTDEASLAQRELLLKEYGLDKENKVSLLFVYGDRDSSGAVTERLTHKIEIGSRALSDIGFYYTVDDRDTIYYTSSNYFEYALRGFYSFIKGTLIAPGLSDDSTFEPYLTPRFEEWVNTQHKKEEEALVGPVVEAGSKVIILGDIILPDSDTEGGYVMQSDKLLTFDLKTLSKHSDFSRIEAMLVGKEVGLRFNALSNTSPVITMLSEYRDSDKFIDFADTDSVSYTYSVTAIESILTPTDEIRTTGAKVADNKLVKVTYTYKVNGETDGKTYHGVFDFSSDALAPHASKFADVGIGNLQSPIELEVVYNKNNALSSSEKLVIKDIIAIYDSTGAQISSVGEDSYVTLTYYEVSDGVASDVATMSLSMKSISENSKWAELYDAIQGKSREKNINITLYNTTKYYEAAREFICYRVTEIDSFITSELVVSFMFKNASERDPYYGESLYENTLPDDDSRSYYGLNASSCQQLVRELGGIKDDSTSSAGLSGTTVALGLTAENMEKYGLYAYTVVFTLPRGIYDKADLGDENVNDESDSSTTSDYGWYSELTFTLYISELDPSTGNRFVGSDMYDLIAEIDGSHFVFLDYSFEEFWARRSLVMLDITKVERFELQFDMEDLSGDYAFDVSMEKIWAGYVGGKLVVQGTYFEGATETERLYVNLSANAPADETKLANYLNITGKDSVSATVFYNQTLGGGADLYDEDSLDTLGVGNFKRAFEQLSLVSYENLLTQEDKANASNAPLLLRMRLKMDSSAYYYTYDFHRVADRKIMVTLYQTDESGKKVGSGSASDFYVSTFAFKKFVNGFVDLLNTEYVDNEVGYPH